MAGKVSLRLLTRCGKCGDALVDGEVHFWHCAICPNRCLNSDSVMCSDHVALAKWYVNRYVRYQVRAMRANKKRLNQRYGKVAR